MSANILSHSALFNGIFTLHGNGTGTEDEERYQWVLICCAELFKLVQERERDRDQLSPIVPAPFAVPPWLRVLVPCSVNRPQGRLGLLSSAYLLALLPYSCRQ